MSTYLQLCSDLRVECNISGTGPASVLNQTGEYARVVNWVKDAWTEIQNRHPHWRWLRSTWSVNTVAGTDTYAGTACTDTVANAAITRFSRWWMLDDQGAPNVKRYLSSGGVSGEIWVPYLPWSRFRAVYKIGTQTNGPPVVCVEDPQNNLVFGPKPDAVYVASGEYQKSAQIFAADADVPEMPSQFHKLIVYEAMKKYAAYQNAPEVMNRGVTEGNRMMRQLEANQLPAISMGGPLA